VAAGFPAARSAEERRRAVVAARSPRLRTPHVEGGEDDRPRGLRKGRNLQIKPFALSSNTAGSLRPADLKATKADAGVDFKYGVTSSMTFDLTWRTDFSQI